MIVHMSGTAPISTIEKGHTIEGRQGPSFYDLIVPWALVFISPCPRMCFHHLHHVSAHFTLHIALMLHGLKKEFSCEQQFDLSVFEHDQRHATEEITFPDDVASKNCVWLTSACLEVPCNVPSF